MNQKKVGRDKYCLADHEFYFALCDGDITGMELALNKLLEPKLAKRAVYDCHSDFEFYLQVQVLMYAKIASIHGYDLNIDSPIAPKELIKYEPLEHYEDPYDFMKKFDYSDHQGWIDSYKEKMRIAKEQEEKEIESKKLKNRILAWFKK